MSRAGSCITAVVGAYKTFLTFLMGMGSLKMQFCSTIHTENLARKDADFSRCGRSAFVFADFLYCLKDIPVYNSKVGILKYPAFFLVVPHTLFAAVILRGCLGVFGMSDIFQFLQNPRNSFLRPLVRLGRKQFPILCALYTVGVNTFSAFSLLAICVGPSPS